MNQLVLSLFPGIGLLDMAFEEEGFTVVRGPDVLWGGDIRRFHPPAGKFDGVIGGPPCQAFSRLNRLVAHNGGSPSFGNLIPEFERCVREASPRWFVMEENKLLGSLCKNQRILDEGEFLFDSVREASEVPAVESLVEKGMLEYGGRIIDMETGRPSEKSKHMWHVRLTRRCRNMLKVFAEQNQP